MAGFRMIAGALAASAGVVVSSSLVLLVLVFAACDGERAPSNVATATITTTTERLLEEASWDTVFEIGGLRNDSALLIPGPTAVSSNGIVLFDYGDSRLKAFDSRGVARWAVGRKGHGPGEFVNPVDVELSSDQEIWVADDEAGRITLLGPDGVPSNIIYVGDKYLLSRLILLRSQTLVVASSASGSFWHAVNQHGSVLRAGAFPTGSLASANPFWRQVLTSVSPTPEKWAAVFPFANTLAAYDGDSLQCTGLLVKGMVPRAEPPAPGQPPRIWAAGVAATENSILVLARDQGTDSDLRILDEFSLDDCRYMGSQHLPERFRNVTYSANVLYFEKTEPVPSILAVRLRRK